MLYINPPTPGLEQRGTQFFGKSPPKPVTDNGVNGYNQGFMSQQSLHSSTSRFTLGDLSNNGSPPMSPGLNSFNQSYDLNAVGRSSPDPHRQTTGMSASGYGYKSIGESSHHMQQSVSETYLDSHSAAYHNHGYNYASDAQFNYSPPNQYSQQQHAQQFRQRGTLTRSRSLKERSKKSNQMAKRRLSLELIPEQDLIAAGIIKVPNITHGISDLNIQGNSHSNSPVTSREFTFSPPPQQNYESYIQGQAHSPQLQRRSQEIGQHQSHHHQHHPPTSSPQSQRHMNTNQNEQQISSQMSQMPHLGSYSQLSSQIHQLSSSLTATDGIKSALHHLQQQQQHSSNKNQGRGVETQLMSWGYMEKKTNSEQYDCSACKQEAVMEQFGASTVAIDNKIEQAMDLVKSHLMYAVREEVEVLREQIKELLEKNSQLEYENQILKKAASPETLAKIQQPRPPHSLTQAPPSTTSS